MLINWDKKALQDYKAFSKDKIAIERINNLLEAIEVQYDFGIGNPERLKHLKGELIYSRRIDPKNRIIYKVYLGSEKQVLSITILGLKGHYEDR